MSFILNKGVLLAALIGFSLSSVSSYAYEPVELNCKLSIMKNTGKSKYESKNITIPVTLKRGERSSHLAVKIVDGATISLKWSQIDVAGTKLNKAIIRLTAEDDYKFKSNFYLKKDQSGRYYTLPLPKLKDGSTSVIAVRKNITILLSKEMNAAMGNGVSGNESYNKYNESWFISDYKKLKKSGVLDGIKFVGIGIKSCK